MNIVKKLVLAVLALLLLGFIGIWITLAVFGKQIVETQLAQNLNTTVSIGSFKVSFPLEVTIEKMKLGTFADIAKITAKPNIAGFLAGKILLDSVEVNDPVIAIEQSSEGKLNLPQLAQKGGTPPPVLLLALTINNGKVSYLDKKIDPQGYSVSADKLNVQIAKVAFPITSLKTDLDASFAVVNAAGNTAGTVAAKGWIDFGKKDMDAVLTIKDLELTTFAPYAGKFLSQKKLLSVKGDLTVLCAAEKNNLTLTQKIKLSKFVYAQEAADESGLSQFEVVKQSLDTFADSKGEVNFEFALHTKLSAPEFTKKEVRKAVLQALAKNLIGSTPEEMIQKLPETIEKFKEIGKQFEGMFKKKKEEAPATPAPQQ